MGVPKLVFQSHFDDKRYTIDDGIETLAYVHKYAK